MDGSLRMVHEEDLGRAMRMAIDPSGLMQRVTDQTLELIAGADGVMIGLADARGVSYVWAAGENAAVFLGTRVNIDSSLSGLAIKSGGVEWSNNMETDPRADREAARRISVRSAVCIPLTRSSETLGVLSVVGSQLSAFDQDDVDALTQLAGYVSSTIALARDLARLAADLLELTNA
jgi:GAF domain-containing protein